MARRPCREHRGIPWDSMAHWRSLPDPQAPGLPDTGGLLDLPLRRRSGSMGASPPACPAGGVATGGWAATSRIRRDRSVAIHAARARRTDPERFVTGSRAHGTGAGATTTIRKTASTGGPFDDPCFPDSPPTVGSRGTAAHPGASPPRTHPASARSNGLTSFSPFPASAEARCSVRSPSNSARIAGGVTQVPARGPPT